MKEQGRVESFMKSRISRSLETKRKEVEKELKEAQRCYRIKLKLENPKPGGQHIASEVTDNGLELESQQIRNCEKILRKIELAEENLELGTYGFCRTCGDPIPIARLEVVPFTDQCCACKEEETKKTTKKKYRA